MLDILIEAALRASFIAAAALAMLWSLRVRAAAVRHRVWTVVMLAMLALPFAIAIAPDVSLPVLPPTYAEAPVVVAPPPGTTAPAAAPTALATLEVEPAPSWDWRAWLLVVYLAGAATLLARLVVGTARVRVLAREAAVVNGRLTSARIATPCTFGWLSPKVLLPADWTRWSAGQLAVVLDHERAHVTRRDPLVQWLALLNRAVFWFHPLAWWLERHLGSLAEEACDDSVLAHGHSPADYSQQLLDIARAAGRRPALPLVGMAMSGSALPKRIAKILDGGTHPPASRAAVAGAGALATLAAAVLGTVTLAQEPARPRSLLEIYELALANDPVVRQAEAEYRALTAARPQAPNAVAAATADYDAARQELLIRVAVPYFGAVTAGRELARQQTMQEALARQLEQAQRRFEVGLTAVTDVQETQANFDRVAASELSAQNELAAARQALRDVVGEPVGELKPLGEDFSLSSPTPSDADQWVATALQRNPALIAARIRAENADGDPARRAAIAGLERVTVQTEQATRSAYLGLVAAIARARALEQSVRSSQTMLRATRVAFDTGTRSSRDVVTADSALRASEAEYVSSVYDYALNMLRLQRAAGGLTEQKIAELSDWF